MSKKKTTKTNNGWLPIKKAPRDRTIVDLWMSVYASPMSFGLSDAFRIVDCWFEDGKWVHNHEGKQKELNKLYITHYRLIPEGPQ